MQHSTTQMVHRVKPLSNKCHSCSQRLTPNARLLGRNANATPTPKSRPFPPICCVRFVLIATLSPDLCGRVNPLCLELFKWPTAMEGPRGSWIGPIHGEFSEDLVEWVVNYDQRTIYTSSPSISTLFIITGKYMLKHSLISFSPSIK